MNMYGISYVLEDVGLALLPGLISGIPSCTIGIAAYILSAIALYTISVRRGIPHAWLSWVPVLNIWIIGSLSDQYRYVVKGQYKSKRKVLLVLEILKAILGTCVIIICLFMVAALMGGALDEVTMETLGPVLAVAGLGFLLIVVTIAAMVIRYMAMYDIYVSCDPANSVLFLVLSILVGITEPFFLFFSRSKDGGMPPRKTASQEPPVEGEVV